RHPAHNTPGERCSLRVLRCYGFGYLFFLWRGEIRIDFEVIRDVIDHLPCLHTVACRVKWRGNDGNTEFPGRYSNDTPAYAALSRETDIIKPLAGIVVE